MKSVSIHGLRKLNFYWVAVRVPLFLVTVATVILFVSLWWWLPKPFTLTIPIRTSRAVQLKLYYTADESKFREDWTSVRFADSRGPLKIIRLPIATSDLRGLKLHVFPGGIVDFGPINLVPLGQAAVPIAASEISILNGSCKAEQMGSITRFYTAPDSDGFDLELKSSQLPLRNATWVEPAAVTLLLCLLLVLVWLGTKPQKIPRLLSPRLTPRMCRRMVVGFSALLVLTTVLKLNGSSSANWRFYADGRLPKDGLILGSAKDVRADEWMTQTPWMLSQAVSEPPLQTSNPNVGDAATGLLVNLPIRHWTTIFRPQFWSFFVLDFEHAFAWYWNLKWYVMVVGGFLFFRLVSRANTVATIAGTILIFFAPYIQWWYSTGASLPETVGMAFAGLWALHTLLRGKTPAAIWFASLVLLYAIENFVYCCYPRFQIPLLYFSALVALWFFFTSPPRPRYRALRWSCLAAVLALVVLCG